MMKVKKITPMGTATFEDAVNEFFRQENISKSDVVHIRPISMNNVGGISDLVWVYVFYDKFDAVGQSAQ